MLHLAQQYLDSILIIKFKKMKKEETKTEGQERKLTLEEKRLIEIRKEIKNNELLDEYVLLYTSITLQYAATLKINFDNLKE